MQSHFGTVYQVECALQKGSSVVPKKISFDQSQMHRLSWDWVFHFENEIRMRNSANYFIF